MEHDESTAPEYESIIQREFRPPKPAVKRPISFVRASHSTPNLPLPKSNLGDAYLSLVLASSSDTAQSSEPPLLDDAGSLARNSICPVCSLPVIDKTGDHETSIAHQVCLQHTHPPSALDRSRKGLVYLQGYGWDPDERRGLGARDREGRLHPVLPQSKEDRAGIGTSIGDTEDGGKKRSGRNTPDKVVKKVGAKEAKKNVAEDKKKRERLQRLFYTDESVLKYLGEDGL